MKISIYRVQTALGGCAFGCEVTGGNARCLSGPAKRMFVRVEGRPADVARFLPIARYAVRRMKMAEARDYLSRCARDWFAWAERKST